MRKESSEEVGDAARRRLELIRLELANAGLAPAEVPAEGLTASVQAPEDPVIEVGRHLRRSDTPVARVAGWLDDRLPATLRGRVRLGGRELVVLVLFAALGLVVAAVVVLRSGSGGGGDLLPPTAVAPSEQPLISTPPSPGAAAVPIASPHHSVVVDVAGRVRHPGVVRLPSGSRVIDALRKAGGVRRHVDLTGLNLARVLTDGEQIVVGHAALAAAPATTGSAAGAPSSGPVSGAALVNINTATEEQLEQLPDVGPVTAQRILAWRQGHGSFTSVNQLLEVDGIGDKTLADMTPYVTL